MGRAGRLVILVATAVVGTLVPAGAMWMSGSPRDPVIPLVLLGVYLLALGLFRALRLASRNSGIRLALGLAIIVALAVVLAWASRDGLVLLAFLYFGFFAMPSILLAWFACDRWIFPESG